LTDGLLTNDSLAAKATARPLWRQSPALVIGALAWLLVSAFYWPEAFSFADEVGYVGESRLLLSGRLLPTGEDPGVWTTTARGLVPKYPIFGSLLMAPLVALTPKAVFALGMLAALALCWIAARVLRGWGTEPAWALLLIAHPTIVIISRTATVDIAMTVFLFGAWQALRRGRRFAAVGFVTALCLIKPTGFMLGGLFAGGEALRVLPRLRRLETDALRDVATLAAALAVGLTLVLVGNKIATGHLWFAYDHSMMDAPPFWYSHFPKTAPAHFRTLLLFPPLLILGALPYIRRRELGPLSVIVGFGTLMCFYFFVDSGTSTVESLVLAPRLLIPVVAFLLLGYAQLLAQVAQKSSRLSKVVRPALVTATVLSTLAISVRHHRWQAPMAAARRSAEQALVQIGGRELAVLPQAAKVGLLYSGRARIVTGPRLDGPVVLCSERSASHRSPGDGPYSCDFPGYRVAARSGDFKVLIDQRLPETPPR
jgi:hypothetical protein